MLEAYNRLMTDICQQAPEMAKQLADEGMKTTSHTNLNIPQMKGQINCLLLRLQVGPMNVNSGGGHRRLHCQLKLMALLVDCVDLVETIGIGCAASRIRDLVTGDRLAAELTHSGFPLNQYMSLVRHSDAGREEDVELSPRLVSLNSQLQGYLTNKKQQQQQHEARSAAGRMDRTTSRILIFVKTRSAVSALLGYLRHHYPDLGANMAVGHGGFDGQSWAGGQAAIIQDFHQGACQLLICTSVLEEGIDVASCDLDIRYSGVNTLIQFIQSRGRARCAGSRFVIIGSHEEQEQAISLASQERVMDSVLAQHVAAYGLPGQFTRRLLLEHAQNEGSEFSQFQRPGGSCFQEDGDLLESAVDGSAVIVEFYPEDSPSLDLNEVFDHLQGRLPAMQ